MMDRTTRRGWLRIALLLIALSGAAFGYLAVSRSPRTERFVPMAILKIADALESKVATSHRTPGLVPVELVSEGNLDEPMEFAIADNGRVYIAERKGGLELYDPATGSLKLIATIPVNHVYHFKNGNEREAEEGLIGVTLDPRFDTNHWIYLLYADPVEPKHVLARWTLTDDDHLIASSRVLILEHEMQREMCCHTGGGMAWDNHDNLLITIGNNSGNAPHSATDERPGHESYDDQRGAGNTNDLRGKIIRIHPEARGGYTIPDGNLFPKGTPKTRPEIFAMGNRNPWRVSVDSKTGYVYWGDVGPDEMADSVEGPKGYDELNQARKPGNFGWPYFIADNRAYSIWNYLTGAPRPPSDPAHPINESPNNTGLRDLPPAQPAFLFYPYSTSDRFPDFGRGARCAEGGPIFRRADFAPTARRLWPEEYEGTWLVTDCMRSWIMAIRMNRDTSDFSSMERLNPGIKLSLPIDLKFGPDGDLYVLDYGAGRFTRNPDAKLVRLEFRNGPRPPNAVASVDKPGGVVPFTARFSASGSMSPDGDALSYRWDVFDGAGQKAGTFETANATMTFNRNGVYHATLTVTDRHGGSATSSLDVVAGNTPPEVSVTAVGNIPGNRDYFVFGSPIRYHVDVKDSEDGIAATRESDRLAVSVDYLPPGFDLTTVSQHGRPVAASTRFAVPEQLLNTTDCRSCHSEKTRVVGPSMVELGGRYTLVPRTLETLIAKVKMGGNGVWTKESAMPPHAGVSAMAIATLVTYMVDKGKTSSTGAGRDGVFLPVPAADDGGGGSLLIRAVYTDCGAEGLPALTSEAMAVLRTGELSVSDAFKTGGVSQNRPDGVQTVGLRSMGFLGYRDLDLTAVNLITASVRVTGRSEAVRLEARIDSEKGPVVGQSSVALEPSGTGGFEQIKIPVSATIGRHDLYVVAVSPRAGLAEGIVTIGRMVLGFKRQ